MWRGFVGIIRRGLGGRRFVMIVRRGCDFMKTKIQDLNLDFRVLFLGLHNIEDIYLKAKT